MKAAFIVVAAGLGLLLSPKASAQEERAIGISIFGAGPAVDEDALQRVYAILGRGVAAGRVMKFFVYGLGAEGGFHGCVELTDPRAARQTLAALRRVQPNRRTTTYDLEVRSSCTCE